MTVVSDRRTNVVNLAVGESLSLTEGGSIFVNAGFGIHGTGGNAVTLAGDIMARADTATGVQLDLGGSVSVLATSLVYGGQTGINTASAANISNAGEIIGLSFVGISTGGAVIFSNSGVVYGDIYALSIGGVSFAGSTVTNTGLLQSSGRGIRIFPDNNYILNFGTIDGGQDGIAFGGTAGTDVVVNWGTIIGHNGKGIDGDASDELIVNRGVIRGFTAAVDLKAGNDTFDNSLGGVVIAPILMGAGNDTVIAGQGAELIDGGDGSDTVSYANSPKKMLINLVGQVTTDADGVQDNLSLFENAVGSAFDDALYGDATGNVLDGGPDGSDLISGAGGIDTVSYASSTRSVLINLAGQITADGKNTDTLSSIENAIGSAFNDTILGDGTANVLDGGRDGSDQISGAGGSDTVSYVSSSRSVLINLGGQITSDGVNTDTLSSIENATGSLFNDTFIGSAGDNVFDGEAGNDLIDGGRGNDAMNGGAGNDRFFFANTSSSGNPANYSGNDVIVGFEKVAGAGGDRVELQDVALGSWSSVESSGNTIFIFTQDTLGAMASVTVVGVTGLVFGDDWIIV